MTPLAGSDGRWLHDEKAGYPLQTVRVLVLEPGYDATVVLAGIRARVAEHLHHHPTFRRRLELGRIPGLGWRWADDALPDLEAHVRAERLPSDAADPVNDATARLSALPMDRSRPLWDITVLVEGHAAVAVAVRLHHALADGSVVGRLLADLFEGATAASPSSPGPPSGSGHAPRSPGSSRWPALVADTVRIATGRRSAGPSDAPGPYHLPAPATAPLLPWSLPGLPGRAVACSSLPLVEVQSAAASLQGRFGEVSLSIVVGALRRYLLDRGQLPAVPLVGSVPVSRWSGGAVPRVGNDVRGLRLGLPTCEPDPVRRYRLVRESLRAGLADLRDRDGGTRRRRLDVDPLPWLASRAAALPTRRRRPGTAPNLGVSIVKGPNQLWCGPAPVTEIRSVLFLSEGLGMTIGVWSYVDRVTFAILTRSNPDIDVAALAAELAPALSGLTMAGVR